MKFVQERYYSGKIHREGNRSQGKKQGEWKIYSDDGSLYEIKTYKDNKLNGVYKRFFKDGVVEQIKYYLDGEEDKSKCFTRYYANGQVKEEDCKKDGSGKLERFFKDGRLKTRYVYENNVRMEFVAYFDNGQLRGKFKRNKDGSFSGEYFSENGERTGYTHGSADGNEDSKYLYNTGVVRKQVKKNSEYEVSEEYYESGRLKEKIVKRNNADFVSEVTQKFDEKGGLLKEVRKKDDLIESERIATDSTYENYSYLADRNYKKLIAVYKGTDVVVSDTTKAGVFSESTSKIAINGMFYKENKTGDWLEYYKNGTLKFKGTYKETIKNNKIVPVGEHFLYYPNGALRSNYNYKLSEYNKEDPEKYYYASYMHGEARYYYPNGNLKQQSFYGEWGKKTGVETKWTEAGVLLSKETFEVGSVRRREIFYENGQLKSLLNPGGFDGEYKIFYDDGNIMQEGQGEWVFTGVKTGTWKAYYRNGVVAREEVYYPNDTKTKSVRLFYPNGKRMIEIDANDNFSEEYESLAYVHFFNKRGRSIDYFDFFGIKDKHSVAGPVEHVFDLETGQLMITSEYYKGVDAVNLELVFE
ncbi:toxin-antitoxin system YwqK family antitoxin [Neptunitalea lumnitzerae]|nr:hypothetical protein [Neptunitalea sp. Y10]